MQLTINWSDKLKLPTVPAFHAFLQKQANRLMQGHARYGAPHASQRYLTRMQEELRAYKKTGNAEHLYNLANYCALESLAPENPRFHFDARAASVTRGVVR